MCGVFFLTDVVEKAVEFGCVCCNPTWWLFSLEDGVDEFLKKKKKNGKNSAVLRQYHIYHARGVGGNSSLLWTALTSGGFLVQVLVAHNT